MGTTWVRWPAATVAACAAVVAGAALLWPVMVDDVFITGRYALNLADGQGPVFNVGDPVEGYSHPLWLLMMTVGQLVGVGPILVAKVGSVAATFGIVVLAVWTFRRLDLTIWSAGALACLVAGPPVLFWSAVGLETTAYALAVTAAAVAAGMARDRWWLPGVLAGVAALLRPEGAAVLAVVVLVGIDRGGLRHAARQVAVFAAVVGPYLAFRLLYFGDLLPNTFYAKSGGLDHLADGVRYTANHMWLAGVLLVALAVVGAVLDRGQVVQACVLTSGVAFAFVLWAGGDWMPEGRFLVPVVTPLVIPAGVAFDRIGRRSRPVVATVAIVAVTAGIVGAVDARDALAWRADLEQSRAELGGWLEDSLPDGATVAAGDMGGIPYHAPSLRFVDWKGLVDDDVARMMDAGVSPDEWVMAQQPDAVVLVRRPGFRHDYADWLPDDPAFQSGYRLAHTHQDVPPGTPPHYPQGRFYDVYLAR